jgi:hypothetical protein
MTETKTMTINFLSERIELPFKEWISLDEILTLFKFENLKEIYNFTGLISEKDQMIPFENNKILGEKLTKISYKLLYTDEKTIKYFIDPDFKFKKNKKKEKKENNEKNEEKETEKVQFDEKLIQKCFLETALNCENEIFQL